MASQNINVGTAANDGTGESLRSAFIDIRKMFAEVYNQTYTSDTQDLSGATFDLYSKPDLGLVGNILTLTKPDGTTDTVDLSPYLDEDARAIASGTLNAGTGINDAPIFAPPIKDAIGPDCCANIRGVWPRASAMAAGKPASS